MKRRRPYLRPDGHVCDTRTIDVDGVPVTYRSHQAPCIDQRTQEAIDALVRAAYRQFAAGDGPEGGTPTEHAPGAAAPGRDGGVGR